MTDQTAASRAPLLMMASMLSFTLNDSFVKLTGGALPVSQLLALRGGLAVLFIAGLAHGMGHLRVRLPRADRGLLALRSIAEASSAYLIIRALLAMPLANVSAILQMLPLTITLGGFLFLREQVGWRRWLAVAAGFGGMLLIVRPGPEGFDINAILALAAVLAVTVRDLATRRMSGAVPSLMVTLAGAVTVLAVACLLSATEGWVPMTPRLWALILAATGCIICGYSFSVLVMRAGEASLTAPFRYSGLVFALILGWLVFGDWPDGLTLTGAAVVALSGGFTMWRERRQAVAAPKLAAPPYPVPEKGVERP